MTAIRVMCTLLIWFGGVTSQAHEQVSAEKQTVPDSRENTTITSAKVDNFPLTNVQIFSVTLINSVLYRNVQQTAFVKQICKSVNLS